MTHEASTIGASGVSLQYLQTKGILEFGSVELTNAIMSRNIKYALCGHVHSGEHTPQNYNNTIVMNVSLLDEDYKIAYKPSIITI